MRLEPGNDEALKNHYNDAVKPLPSPRIDIPALATPSTPTPTADEMRRAWRCLGVVAAVLCAILLLMLLLIGRLG